MRESIVKKIDKIRIKDKRIFISIMMLVAILFVSWFFESQFAEVMFFMDYSASDLEGLDPRSVKEVLLPAIMSWELGIDSAMRYVVNFLPVFAVFPALSFLQERKSYFVLGANRFFKYRREIIKSIVIYSVRSGFVIAVSFTGLFLIGACFMHPEISNIGGFASIFPDTFYMQHPCLFFLFMTWTVYFAFGIVFGLMACGLSLLFDKEIYILIIPLLLYLGESYIGNLIDFLPLKISESVCAFNTLYSTGEIFIPVITIFLFDMILVNIGMKKQRRLIDG